MPELIKEERFIYCAGTEDYFLRVQELVSGSTPWPKPFRIQLPTSDLREARKFYGTTARDVVEQAIDYISSTSIQDRQSSPDSPRSTN